MPTINFTVTELENLQDALLTLQTAKLLFRMVDRWDLSSISGKIDASIGDKIKMLDRGKIEDGIKQCFKNDPQELATVMKSFERDYPLPEGLRKH